MIIIIRLWLTIEKWANLIEKWANSLIEKWAKHVNDQFIKKENLIDQ